MTNLFFPTIISALKFSKNLNFSIIPGRPCISPGRHIYQKPKSALFERSKANSDANGLLWYWSHTFNWCGY